MVGRDQLVCKKSETVSHPYADHRLKIMYSCMNWIFSLLVIMEVHENV